MAKINKNKSFKAILESPYLTDDLREKISKLSVELKEKDLKELYKEVDKFISEQKIRENDLKIEVKREKDNFEENMLDRIDQLINDLEIFRAQISEEEKSARVREVHKKILS